MGIDIDDHAVGDTVITRTRIPATRSLVLGISTWSKILNDPNLDGGVCYLIIGLGRFEWIGAEYLDELPLIGASTT